MEGKIRLLKSFLLSVCALLFLSNPIQAQSTPYYKGALKDNRANEYRNLVNNIIIQNLSLPLTDSTEENWQDAFAAMELVQYKTPWIDNRVHYAFDSIQKRSIEFQRALLELCYANYPKDFGLEIDHAIATIKTEENLAICIEYLYQLDSFKIGEGADTAVFNTFIANAMSGKTNPILRQAAYRITNSSNNDNHKAILYLFKKDFLSKNIIVFSFQRKNRDYPGLAIVRDAKGNFIKNNDSSIFYVPQLARSLSNLPSYLTNGNTPQGIFRMDGFAVSGGSYIGPTENIQLTMPYETSIRHFLNNPKISDTTWTIDLYKKLLPSALQDSMCLYETYYAGEAGRGDIIAHGSTINPQYYKYKPYYPITPTEGCLCTEEIWSTINGRRVESDQQLLVDAVKKAGGATGYYIVIEIDDAQKPVSMDEILPFIK